jgi:hypothetical protein
MVFLTIMAFAAWYTAGFDHLPRTEDPLMPAGYSFIIRTQDSMEEQLNRIEQFLSAPA